MTPTPTRPTREIEPLVPIMPHRYAPDGGRESTVADADQLTETTLPRPPQTAHAPADRDREAIEPLVPDLR